MRPEDIKKQLEEMLELANGKTYLIYGAWEVAYNLYNFYSEVDSNTYNDDDYFTSECYQSMMRPWNKIEDFIFDGYNESKQKYNEEKLSSSIRRDVNAIMEETLKETN